MNKILRRHIIFLFVLQLCRHNNGKISETCTSCKKEIEKRIKKTMQQRLNLKFKSAIQIEYEWIFNLIDKCHENNNDTN